MIGNDVAGQAVGVALLVVFLPICVVGFVRSVRKEAAKRGAVLSDPLFEREVAKRVAELRAEDKVALQRQRAEDRRKLEALVADLEQQRQVEGFVRAVYAQGLLDGLKER